MMVEINMGTEPTDFPVAFFICLCGLYMSVMRWIFLINQFLN